MKFTPRPEAAKHLDELDRNAVNYFAGRFQKCSSIHGTGWATLPDGETVYFKRIVYYDTGLGVQYRVIVIDGLDESEIKLKIVSEYDFLDVGNIGGWSMNSVPTDDMPVARRTFIYTDKIESSESEIVKTLNSYTNNKYFEIIVQSKMHKTLFISYGGPDENIANDINNALSNFGISTWFFAKDAIPGEKLHRVMTNAVYNFDRTLLICSKSSVERCGVLNEIERMLEREASEGGQEIIVPISLDSYIFDSWHPERNDIKKQLLSRVVCRYDQVGFDESIKKIIAALKVP